MKAAIYTRVSDEEAARGHSLDSQRRLLEAWAEREVWQVVAYYEDPGISAATMEDRPAFMRMLGEASTFDVLLVLKQDRFARDIADAFAAERILQRAGARVLYHDEPGANDAESPAGLIMKAVGYAGAQGYRMDLSRKITRGYETMATHKGLHVGDVPFGYRRPDPKQPMEIDEREAEAVRWAFETYATGNVSYRNIADELTRRGFRPHSKVGREAWSVATVAHMLERRTYLGEVRYRGEWYPGRHPSIIDEPLFERVRAAAAARKRAPRTYSPSKRFYLVTGLADCFSCDSRLVADTSGPDGRYRYYRCGSRWSRKDCSDQRTGIRAERVEEHVERAIVATAERLSGFTEAVYAKAHAAQPVDIRAEQKRLEQTISRATRALIGGGDEKTALEAIAEARRKLIALKSAPKPQDAGTALLQTAELWAYLAPDDRKAAARVIFERVGVNLRERAVGVLPRPEYRAIYNAVAAAGQGPIFLDWYPREDSNLRPND